MMMVAFGAGLGALVRYNLTNIYKKHAHTVFPWITLIINLSGAFLLGLVKTTDAALFLGTGFLGGYTTFSTYNTELLALIQDKYYRQAGIYFVISAFLGPLCAFLGWYLAGMLK
ncbi:fluoride efflux transporter FluC [Ligilactobacillus sp. WC1T17]